MTTSLSTVRLNIAFDWNDAGQIELDQAGALRFPPTATDPGIYRFALSLENRTSVYIGEADKLARRMQHYRTPGPGQATNIRLNSELRRVLAGGGQARLAIASRARFEINNRVAVVDLGNKAYRVLVEHAALVEAISSGADEVINLLRAIES